MIFGHVELVGDLFYRYIFSEIFRYKVTRSSHVLVKCRRGVIIVEFIVIKRAAQKSILSKISSKKILLLSVFSALILLGGDAREIL